MCLIDKMKCKYLSIKLYTLDNNIILDNFLLAFSLILTALSKVYCVGYFSFL